MAAGGYMQAPEVVARHLALVALAVNSAASRAIRQPTPELIQKTVKTGILSLIWLNVGLVAAVRGVEPACVIAALWAAGMLALRSAPL